MQYHHHLTEMYLKYPMILLHQPHQMYQLILMILKILKILNYHLIRMTHLYHLIPMNHLILRMLILWPR